MMQLTKLQLMIALERASKYAGTVGMKDDWFYKYCERKRFKNTMRTHFDKKGEYIR